MPLPADGGRAAAAAEPAGGAEAEAEPKQQIASRAPPPAQPPPPQPPPPPQRQPPPLQTQPPPPPPPLSRLQVLVVRTAVPAGRGDADWYGAQSGLWGFPKGHLEARGAEMRREEAERRPR